MCFFPLYPGSPTRLTAGRVEAGDEANVSVTRFIRTTEKAHHPHCLSMLGTPQTLLTLPAADLSSQKNLLKEKASYTRKAFWVVFRHRRMLLFRLPGCRNCTSEQPLGTRYVSIETGSRGRIDPGRKLYVQFDVIP